MNEELYGIDQVEWNDEQAIFKNIMRAVVYRTRGVYFDSVKDTDDETAVVCQLWTGEPLPATGETMSWYAIDKVTLRQLEPERLIAQTIAELEKVRDDAVAFWRDTPAMTDEAIEREWRKSHPDGDRWQHGLLPEDIP